MFLRLWSSQCQQHQNTRAPEDASEIQILGAHPRSNASEAVAMHTAVCGLTSFAVAKSAEQWFPTWLNMRTTGGVFKNPNPRLLSRLLIPLGREVEGRVQASVHLKAPWGTLMCSQGCNPLVSSSSTFLTQEAQGHSHPGSPLELAALSSKSLYNYPGNSYLLCALQALVHQW